MKAFLKATLMAITFSITVLGIGYVFFYFGPMYETRFMPVFEDVDATVVAVDKEHDMIHVVVTGKKARPCEWKSIAALVERNGQWFEGAIFLKDPRGATLPPNTPTTTRPPGKQHLGEAFIAPVGDKVQVYLQHRCHPMWQTQTLMYELDMRQRPAQIK